MPFVRGAAARGTNLHYALTPSELTERGVLLEEQCVDYVLFRPGSDKRTSIKVRSLLILVLVLVLLVLLGLAVPTGVSVLLLPLLLCGWGGPVSIVAGWSQPLVSLSIPFFLSPSQTPFLSHFLACLNPSVLLCLCLSSAFARFFFRPLALG